MAEPSILANPVIQYGFAGMCLLLISIIVWLISRLLQVLKDTNEVVAHNTEAIKELTLRMMDQSAKVNELRDAMRERPCIMAREQ